MKTKKVLKYLINQHWISLLFTLLLSLIKYCDINWEVFVILKETEHKKQAPRQDKMIEQTYRTKRPRKAALAKNYKELSSSEESESEREYSACTSKKEKSKIQVYRCTVFLKMYFYSIFWNRLWSTFYLDFSKPECYLR